MTAEKPEGDVARLVKRFREDALQANCECEPDVGWECFTCSAADALESQSRRIQELEEALREVVACKDMKEYLDAGREYNPQRWDKLHDAYHAREPLAWKAARRALSGGLPTDTEKRDG